MTSMLRRLILVTLPLCSLCLSAPLHAASPALGAIMPRGGQRGTEVAVTFSGARLGDAQEILVYYPGVTVANLKAANDTTVQATFKIAADCRLGGPGVRGRTGGGDPGPLTFHPGGRPGVQAKVPDR